MAKQKTIPELEVEKAENERKLSQLQHKKQQLENRITYYEKGDRRKRAHHLITRGAAIESVVWSCTRSLPRSCLNRPLRIEVTAYGKANPKAAIHRGRTRCSGA